MKKFTVYTEQEEKVTEKLLNELGLSFNKVIDSENICTHFIITQK